MAAVGHDLPTFSYNQSNHPPSKLTNYLGSDYYYRTGSESVPLTKQEKADYMVKRVQSKNLELSE